MIKLEHISRIYERKDSKEAVKALDDISISFPEKGLVAVLGASGSGKTTLLNIIGGLDKATSGNMEVDSLSTSSFKGKDWDSYRNEKIGFVLQNCYLIPHMSINDNVKIKLQLASNDRKEIDRLTDEALKAVGLYERRKDKPKQLSGGQKQRVAIARAIVNKPTVILADEPTGALDSKTGKQIMELLKELSKERLVILVTHNKDYAERYADRIVELQDGKITSDSNNHINNINRDKKKLKKVRIPFFTSLKWGFKNLIDRKYSSISIIIASALGLAGIGLILSISDSVKVAFVETEAKSLSKYPVTISSYSTSSPEGSAPSYVEYTDQQIVYADLSYYAKQDHYNTMSSRFTSYMANMPKDYYYVSYDSSVTNFQLYTKVNEGYYKKISSTSQLFYKGIDNDEFMASEYDCLKGRFASNEHEVVLVVDTYNRVDGYYLNQLGFDVDTSVYAEISFTFDELLGKTYKYIANNDYYVYNESTQLYGYPSKNAMQLYNESTYELEVVGIIRQKRNAGNPLFRTGVLYTTAFEQKVLNDNANSDIVLAQLEAGYTKNVITGQEIVDQQSGSTTYSKEYVYESLLFQLGAYERVTNLYYFTQTFTHRNSIHEYFNAYQKDESVDFNTLNYNDYLERVSFEFDGALTMMTSVLYVFAAISVLVSAILNAILTYISIHQRTAEIGLLRSLGARRKDIAVMIETESIITGILGSCLSVLLAILLVQPINVLVTDAIYKYNFYLLSKVTFTLQGFHPWVAAVMIGIGVVTSILSALVPSLIASRKEASKAMSE